MQTILSKMFFINLATYKAVLSLQGTLSRSPVVDCFTLEDAIGRTTPVPLQFINSWLALEAVLENRFLGIQGFEKIQRGQYALHDSATGMDIARQRNWEGAFLPGQKVNMSMLFRCHRPFRGERSSESSATTCPWCHSRSTQSTDSEVNWFVICYCVNLCQTHASAANHGSSGCARWYQRVTKLRKLPVSNFVPRDLGVSPLGTTCEILHAPVGIERKSDTADELGAAGFKRIRILSIEYRGQGPEGYGCNHPRCNGRHPDQAAQLSRLLIDVFYYSGGDIYIWHPVGHQSGRRPNLVRHPGAHEAAAASI